MEIDYCKDCPLIGDYNKCLKENCTPQQAWIFKEQSRRLQCVDDKLKNIKDIIEGLHDDIESFLGERE